MGSLRKYAIGFWLVSSLLALLPRPGLAQEEAPPATRPNIIFVLVDDQRYDFLSFLDHPWIETPHIDRLAADGLFFTRAYVTTSLCSPSRASILTGQYAHTHQVADNDTPLPAGTPTFPRELQRAGYRTGFVGKWHMGGDNDSPRPGFDHWVSFQGQGPYRDPTLNMNGIRKAVDGYTPEILTQQAIAFIREASDGDRPYFLYLSHKSVHEPFTPAPQHAGHYEGLTIPRPASFAHTDAAYAGKPRWVRRQRNSWHGAERDFSIQEYGDFDRFFQLYSECMLGVDQSIGELTAALEEIGQLEETLILYFSDNGYMMGEHGLIDKRVMYEPSIRVPAFVHYPTLIREGRQTDKFVLNIDIGPTLLELAGATVPESMHGRSFVPLLIGNEENWRTDFLYEYFIDPQAVQTPTMFGLRNERYSYTTYEGVWDTYELYDLKEDPDQRNNLLGQITYGHDYGSFLRHVQRQDPDLYTTVSRLDARLTDLVEETGGKRQAEWKQ